MTDDTTDDTTTTEDRLEAIVDCLQQHLDRVENRLHRRFDHMEILLQQRQRPSAGSRRQHAPFDGLEQHALYPLPHVSPVAVFAARSDLLTTECPTLYFVEGAPDWRVFLDEPGEQIRGVQHCHDTWTALTPPPENLRSWHCTCGSTFTLLQAANLAEETRLEKVRLEALDAEQRLEQLAQDAELHEDWGVNDRDRLG